MLNATDEVRGDSFHGSHPFSYSQHVTQIDKKNAHDASVSGQQPVTAPGDTTRSHSIDVTNAQRPLPQPPSAFAEKEARLLLDKISEINKIERAPKQPCQKLQLKRFTDEMDG